MINTGDFLPRRTDMIDDLISEESLRELHIIEQRQQALQQMIKIAQLAEQLNQSLNSVIILGKPIKNMPEKLLTAYARLQEKTSQYSDSEITRKVRVLESKIKQSYQYAGVKNRLCLSL